MLKVTAEQKEQIKQHTLACYPEEMCGVLTTAGFLPCGNVAEDREKHFKLSAIRLAQILHDYEVLAIVHSHIRDAKNPELLDTRTPSLADIRGQRETDIPWLIVATEGDVVTPALELPRDKELPYVGRPFIWFISDCYTLVQDYYSRELNITLPDHKEDFEFRDLRRFDGLFDDYLQEYGFKSRNSITDLKNGDLLLLDNAGSKRNHLGIYHEGKVIHQDAVSVEVPFSTFVGRINEVLRYVG